MSSISWIQTKAGGNGFYTGIDQVHVSWTRNPAFYGFFRSLESNGYMTN